MTGSASSSRASGSTGSRNTPGPYERRSSAADSTGQSPAGMARALVNAVVNLYGLDRTDLSILEESLLRAQSELLQGQLAIVQHRLQKAERRGAPERIVVE